MMIIQGIIKDPKNIQVNKAELQLVPKRVRADLCPSEDAKYLLKEMKETEILTSEEISKIEKKCFKTQDAHCIPGQLKINGKALQYYLPEDSFTRMDVEGKFGAVHRISTIFNETDSVAEKSGLIVGFKSACIKMVELHKGKKNLDHKALKAAYEIYVKQALQAIDSVVGATQSKGDQASSDFYKRFYYLVKSTIASAYSQYTKDSIPDVIAYPEMLGNFENVWSMQ